MTAWHEVYLIKQAAGVQRVLRAALSAAKKREFSRVGTSLELLGVRRALGAKSPRQAESRTRGLLQQLGVKHKALGIRPPEPLVDPQMIGAAKKLQRAAPGIRTLEDIKKITQGVI